MSMIAWATASVTTSASVTLRRAFLLRHGRRSSAVANTAVSSRSRSASIVALPGRRRDIGTADFDRRCVSPAQGVVRPNLADSHQEITCRPLFRRACGGAIGEMNKTDLRLLLSLFSAV